LRDRNAEVLDMSTGSGVALSLQPDTLARSLRWM
jgi:hypothetical protein